MQQNITYFRLVVRGYQGNVWTCGIRHVEIQKPEGVKR